MGKSKKAFIDRKKAVTFHLVHRSQHDPLVADETAPQHVLVEAPSNQHNQTNQVDSSKRREEQRKYGVLFDDDYDYLQHLKHPGQEAVWEYVENPNNTHKGVKDKDNVKDTKLQLPSSVFASEFEEEEGLLNKAAPHSGLRLDWDPDIIAALNDDFDFNDEQNQMEDDFVVQAMGNDNDDESTEQEGSFEVDSNYLQETDSEDEREFMDRLAPLIRERRFNTEETKSRFTEYSMSSSVIRRNEQLTLLDDRFERFYASYDEPELGDLATEDIEGTWHQKHPYVLGCLKEFKKSNQIEYYNKEWDRERLVKYREVVDGDEDPNDEMIEYEVQDTKEKKWDCESVISTYSNMHNRPKMITEPTYNSNSKNQSSQKIEIDPKTGLPTNVLRGDNKHLTARALLSLGNEERHQIVAPPKSLCAKSVLSTLSVLSIRPKDETSEEKRERKRLLKEYRNERRIEKKANTEAFKIEKKRQTHIKINQLMNQKGKKIV